MVTRSKIRARPKKKAPTADNGRHLDFAGPESSGRTRQSLIIERARTTAALVGQLTDYNPDDLVVTTGNGVRVYQDMLRDPYVKAALGIKKIAVSKLPRKILPASEDGRDQEIARFVEWSLENMETPIDTMLWGVMDAVDVGYSLSEINWKNVANGRYAGKISLSSVKSKDSWVYTFDLDDFGNIRSVYQRFGYVWGVSPEESRIDLPPDKFVIMSFMPRYSNPYGSSDLRAAYRAFFIKDWAWKFRAIYMEKFGMPPLIGRFPNGTDEARRKKLEQVLESIQNETVMTVPEDLQIEVLKLALEGRMTEYERAIADLNKEILIGILFSFLSVEEGKRTGARAAGKVHFDVMVLVVEHLACAVQDVVNRQLIRRLVDLNFDVDGRYPVWNFDVSNAEKLLKDLEIDQGLSDLGVRLEDRYFYDKYRRPTPSEAGSSRPIGPDFFDEFCAARGASLPDDPKKISVLRDAYRTLVLVEGRRRRIDVDDPSRAAYDLAGEERAHRIEHGSWREPRDAYRRFLERIRRD